MDTNNTSVKIGLSKGYLLSDSGKTPPAQRDLTVINIAHPNKASKSKVPFEFEAEIPKVDGQIKSFSQGKVRDCYFLARVQGYSQTPAGAKLIKDVISQDSKGNATVKWNESEKYTFTSAQINAAEGRFSTGDANIRVLELAWEQHRRALPPAMRKPYYNPKSPADEGIPSEIDIVLAHKKGESLPDPEYVAELSEKAHSFHFDLIQTGTKSTKEYGKAHNPVTAGLYKINEYNAERDAHKKFDKVLGLKQRFPKQFVVSTGFKKRLSDEIYTGHSYNIQEVSKDSVTLNNPYYSTRKIKLSRAEVVENTAEIDFVKL